MFLYKCLCEHRGFYFLGCMSTIAGSYSNSILSLLRNYQTVFQSDRPILHSHQSRMRGPGSPHLQQHLLSPVFFTLTILVDVIWYLVVLICISLMTDDVEHLFMCFWAICIFFFGEIFSDSFSILKLGLPFILR